MTGVFLVTWKISHFIQCTKRMTNTLLMIFVQFLFYLFVENYLKESFLVMHLCSLKIVRYS